MIWDRHVSWVWCAHTRTHTHTHTHRQLQQNEQDNWNSLTSQQKAAKCPWQETSTCSSQLTCGGRRRHLLVHKLVWRRRRSYRGLGISRRRCVWKKEKSSKRRTKQSAIACIHVKERQDWSTYESNYINCYPAMAPLYSDYPNQLLLMVSVTKPITSQNHFTSSTAWAWFC